MRTASFNVGWATAGPNGTTAGAYPVGPMAAGTPGASGLSLTGRLSSPRSNRYVGAVASASYTRGRPRVSGSGSPATGSRRTWCGSNTARNR